MYPIVEQFIAAITKADGDYQKAENAARAAMGASFCCSAHASRDLRMRDAAAAHVKARRDAWDILVGSDDPMVRFVHGKCRGYPSHALAVLQVLPATVGELWDLADRKDWCGDFESFLIPAMREGAVPGVSPQRGELLSRLWGKWIDDGADVDRASLRKLMGLLDAVVDAERLPRAETLDSANPKGVI